MYSRRPLTDTPAPKFDQQKVYFTFLPRADELRVISLEKPLSQLGWLYVFEGSTLGVVLVRQFVSRALLLTGEEVWSICTVMAPLYLSDVQSLNNE